MSEGALFKPDKDYTSEADKILPAAEALAKVMGSEHSRELQLTCSQKDIQEAIDKILSLEKQARQACIPLQTCARRVPLTNL